MITIRQHRQDDVPSLEQCMAELQDFERTIEPNRREGASVSVQYIDWMLKKCAERNGKVFVAEEEEVVIGFCSVWVEKRPQELISTLTEYAFVSDIVLLPAFRGKGAGKLLLEAAEKHAREQGMETMIINALAKNARAVEVYKKFGFEGYEILMRKKL